MASATIYDVAERAGVSSATVSRLLSGFEGIKPSTRQRVEDAIRDLNYHPNSSARHLRLRRTNRIGFIADRMGQTGPSQTIVGAAEAARDQGYVLDVLSIDGGDESSVHGALDVLTSQQIAGIVISAQTFVTRAALERRAFAFPVTRDFELIVDGTGETMNHAAGRVAAEHLIGLGHRRIGYLAGPSAWTASIERRAGFEDVIARNGGVVTAIGEGDWSVRSGYEVGACLARGPERFTALAVANDAMALGALAAFAAAGLNVPGDVSVIGTDNTPESEFMVPSLSTVAIDFDFEGRYVVTTLISEIEGRDAHGGLRLAAPSIVTRRSTAPTA